MAGVPLGSPKPVLTSFAAQHLPVPSMRYDLVAHLHTAIHQDPWLR